MRPYHAHLSLADRAGPGQFVMLVYDGRAKLIMARTGTPEFLEEVLVGTLGAPRGLVSFIRNRRLGESKAVASFQGDPDHKLKPVVS